LERKGNGKNKVIKEMGVVVGRLVWIVFGLVGLVVENVILSGGGGLGSSSKQGN
jgi:hypothetical protein